MSVLSHAELDEKLYSKPQWLIDPYIPRQGTVFLWGDTSIGKSPVTWHMAQAVASGKSFFGLPATLGVVLYLEMDTPEISVVPRLQQLKPTVGDEWKHNLHWVFDESFTVPPVLTAKSQTTDRLLELQEALDPALVIVNTCRKVHGFDDKDSKAPSMVYGFFKQVFPQAATVFVHHERKRSRDPDAHEYARESFSGSKHWINDAQVGLQLVSHRPAHAKTNLRILHHKTQVSERVRALELKLEDDGTNIVCPLYEEYISVWQEMKMKPELQGREFDREVGKSLGLSERSVRRRRKDIELGLWPKSRAWLGRADAPQKDEEEEEKSDG
jgi:hypothetical protein